MPAPKSAWDRTLNQLPEPELHAFAQVSNSPLTTATLLGLSEFGTSEYSQGAAEYFDIPEFRKYQNSHIAPTRIYVGCGAVAVGGVMMIAGYKQDTKYEWSGPYMSPSPLNMFGMMIIALGITFIVSGLIFYSKFRKHTIMPYNKSY